MTAKFLTLRFALAFAVLFSFYDVSVALAAPPRPEVVAIAALHAAGADLGVDLVLLPGAPAKLVVALETAAGQPEGSVVLTPARTGRATVFFPAAVERFLTDGFDYRLRLRDDAGIEVAEAASFTVGMTCAGEVCRFVPELGVETGAAVWLEDRLASALRAADPATSDLLAAAVEADSGLLGAARDLSARLAAGADGSCRCRWAYSTTPAACGDPGTSLGIFDRGVREDELSARRVRRGAATLETACWTARLDGSEKIRIAFGDREATVGWPRVALSSCGSCGGSAVSRTAFLGGAHAVAAGTSAVETRASWSFDVSIDGTVVLSESDVRAAASPAGEDRDERLSEWNGVARTIAWEAELETLLKAPAGVDRGSAEAQFGYRIRTTGEAACATPPHVEVGRIGGWHFLDEPLANPFDPNQISVVIGECRPPN